MLKNINVNRTVMLLTGSAGIALLSAATTSMAQNTTIIGGSGSSGVYINEQLIGSVPAYSNGYSNTYGSQNILSGYPGSNGSEYLSRPGNLLYPPQTYPHSQITIQNFSNFQPQSSGYTQQGYNAPAYAPQGYNTPVQQPGLTSGSSLYNPYGQPLVPLSQVSQPRVASTGTAPQYPAQVPAFQPQSQLLVPPPAGSIRPKQVTSPPIASAPAAPILAQSQAVETPSTVVEITPPAAPKVVKKAAEPLQITQVPSPVTPPAPPSPTITPTAPEPIAQAPSVEPESVIEAPAPQSIAPLEPAPVIESVTSEPILTPPPVPAPVTAEASTGIPSAPVIATQPLVESTDELAPPPPPTPTVETASADPAVSAASVGPIIPIKLFFEPEHAELSTDAKLQLNQLADALLADETKVIQLHAYASDTESGAQARRVSLSRALAVTGVLMERGIKSTRMHVRALGNKSKDGNPDRVEIIPVQN
ncbi:OmpA family protein [Kiloniella sp.]|uniref:OmpA family protein n=1 Tax=Kiloniella sp. TaxID=1938587 RepID=UPI003B01E520